MLSHHIEAEALDSGNIELQRGFIGLRVDAVGPKALVERADLKDELVVQQHFFDAVVHADGDFPHSEVALNRVGHGSVLHHLDAEGIQIGMRRRPQRFVRHGNGQRFAQRSADGADDFAGGQHGDDGFGVFGRHRRVDRDADGFGVDVRDNLQIFDRRRRNRLQPHGLPDARGGRVHNAAGVDALLSARLARVIGGVEDAHNQLLRAGFGEIGGHVIGEWQVAAPVRAHALAVDKHL